MDLTRRGFLQAGTLGFAAGALGLNSAEADEPKKTRLVMVQDPDSTDQAGVGNSPLVREMVHRAVSELTGKDALADAWACIVKPADVVGLKINLRGGTHMSTQPCVVNAIIEGLTAAGVAPNNIIVWDALAHELEPAGYTINNSDQGVRYLATDFAKPSADYSKDRKLARPAYADEGVKVADRTVHFTRILTETVTAVINVPVIKDHIICGVTCAMKNHYGSVLTPNELHGNHCDPYLPELNLAPVVRDKTRLILVDGLRALYHGGPRDNPQYHWNPGAIIAATDPVAIDTLALRIVEEKRAKEGMDPVAPRAHYIETAAKLGLGANKLDDIDFKTVRKDT